MSAEIDAVDSDSTDVASIGRKEITDVIVAVDDSTVALDDSTVALDVLVTEVLSCVVDVKP